MQHRAIKTHEVTVARLGVSSRTGFQPGALCSSLQPAEQGVVTEKTERRSQSRFSKFSKAGAAPPSVSADLTRSGDPAELTRRGTDRLVDFGPEVDGAADRPSTLVTSK